MHIQGKNLCAHISRKDKAYWKWEKCHILTYMLIHIHVEFMYSIYSTCKSKMKKCVFKVNSKNICTYIQFWYKY